MSYCIAHNISSPLGWTSADNYRAVRAGKSCLCVHRDTWRQPPFLASIFELYAVEQHYASVIAKPNPRAPYTRFEQLVISSITEALSHTRVNPAGRDTLLILSTTKGNVELLDIYSRFIPLSRVLPAETAAVIARHFRMVRTPIVVSNACISGACALAYADRLLRSDRSLHNVIVCGCDVQSRFTISGFMSFKAVSPEPCRPFDKDRRGLNLGEAAATIILSNDYTERPAWNIAAGAIRNDANHISGPSRTGEGSYRALCAAMQDITPDDLAFVNVHGTATPYNDEMEAIALSRAGLEATPVNALKGIYGHTMGAAGVLESVISMMAADEGVVLPTTGFHELGVSRPVSVSAEARPAKTKTFIKLLSGFGGCNAAIRWTHAVLPIAIPPSARFTALATVRLAPWGLVINGEPVLGGQGLTLDYVYRNLVGGYPKFHKMDGMCRLAFLCAEFLARNFQQNKDTALPEETAVVLAGRQGCLANDEEYQRHISFPSPATFVYTLPNIATGEIAIRHHFHGETSFFYMEENNAEAMRRLTALAFQDPATHYAIAGWVDYSAPDNFDAVVSLYTRNF